MTKRNFYLIVLLFLFGFKGISQDKEESFKVITYNIWNGFDWGNDEDRRAKLCEWMNEQNPTIVG